MQTIGIVAEWNPFHHGHAKLIAQARSENPGACIISVMSGAFCQRGEAAAFDKWSRADMALAGGADLVLELPQVYATASLEGFARGGVHTLLSLISINKLYCGSESGNATLIEKLARYLKAHTQEFDTWTKTALASGESYASASQRFLGEAHLSEDASQLGPNDRLALQYSLALPEATSLHLFKRSVSHDATIPDGLHLSGSAIRAGLKRADNAIWPYLPDTTVEIIQKSASTLSDENALLRTLKIYICSHNADDIATQADIRDGWTPRFIKAIKEADTYPALLDLAQTRQYSRSRIQRLCIELLSPSPATPDFPGYVRILGANARGRRLLSQRANDNAPLILNVGKDKRKLTPSAQMLLEHDINRQNLASQLCGNGRFDQDYFEPPHMIL